MEKRRDIKDPTNIIDLERTSSISAGETSSLTQDAKLYNKIDRHIMPLAFLCYFMQFLDKVVINYAKVMGLEKSLDMHGQDFSWMATAFFIAYGVAEAPQGFLLQKLPLSKVLGVNMLGWGVLLACSAAAKDFAGIATLRVLLGACESVVTPALVLLTGQWYTKRQACPRIGIWYCGLGAGQMVGGLISWAGQHGSKMPGSFEGWRIMMICVGIANLMVAVSVLLFLPNSLEAAKWLTASEKQQVSQALTIDQAGNGKRVFKKAGIFEALTDPAVWLMVMIATLTLVPSGVIVTFSATLVAGFGYNSKKSALLNMPSGVVSIFATLISTFAILYNVPRWLCIVFLQVPTVIGACLMCFLEDNQSASLAGIYLVNFVVAPLALIYALVAANTQGYTKRIAAIVMIQVGFSVANIIGPQTFRAHEAPGYISAKITLVAVNVGAMVFAVLLRLLYGWRNARTKASQPSHQLTVAEDDLTDRTNPSFRYVY